MTRLEILHIMRANLQVAAVNLDALIASETEPAADSPPAGCAQHPGAPVKIRASFGGDPRAFCSFCGEPVEPIANPTNYNPTQGG